MADYPNITIPCVMDDPFNYQDNAQTNANPPNLYVLGYAQLMNLMEWELNNLVIDSPLARNHFPADVIDTFMYPFLNPSGVWADYNPLVRFYLKLLQLVAAGQIPASSLAPPPRVENYPNTSSPQTEWYRCSS